jgi:hypothetical protein
MFTFSWLYKKYCWLLFLLVGSLFAHCVPNRLHISPKKPYASGVSADSVIDLSHLNGQPDCLLEIVQVLDEQLKASLGAERYQVFYDNKGTVSMSITIDTLGYIKQLGGYQLKDINEVEFRHFYEQFSKNIRFCVYAYDRLIPYENLVKHSQNNIRYTLHVRWCGMCGMKKTRRR